MKQYTYLLIDLGCLFVPFLASFYKPRAFYKYWRYVLISNVVVATPFLVWDAIFTTHQVWGFNPDYLTGYYLLNLPLEEILFFFCIPYACVFTYFALQYLLPNNPLQRYQKGITVLFIAVSLLFMVVGFDRLYTFYTGLFTCAALVYCLWKKTDLSYFYIGYFAILPFFLMSNGLLTGSLLDEPIVWYNNAENLGVRVGTIPIEDSVYGLLLILLNVLLFERLKSGAIPSNREG